jgi:hypothetical protein
MLSSNTSWCFSPSADLSSALPRSASPPRRGQPTNAVAGYHYASADKSNRRKGTSPLDRYPFWLGAKHRFCAPFSAELQRTVCVLMMRLLTRC